MTLLVSHSDSPTPFPLPPHPYPLFECIEHCIWFATHCLSIILLSSSYSPLMLLMCSIIISLPHINFPFLSLHYPISNPNLPLTPFVPISPLLSTPPSLPYPILISSNFPLSSHLPHHFPLSSPLFYSSPVFTYLLL